MTALATFTSDERDGARVLHVAGELDLSNVAELSAAVAPAPGEELLVVDLAGVTYLDSSAVETLLVRARAAPPLHLVSAAGTGVRGSLDVLGIDALVPVVDTVEQALALRS